MSRLKKIGLFLCIVILGILMGVGIRKINNIIKERSDDTRITEKVTETEKVIEFIEASSEEEWKIPKYIYDADNLEEDKSEFLIDKSSDLISVLSDIEESSDKYFKMIDGKDGVGLGNKTFAPGVTPLIDMVNIKDICEFFTVRYGLEIMDLYDNTCAVLAYNLEGGNKQLFVVDYSNYLLYETDTKLKKLGDEEILSLRSKDTYYCKIDGYEVLFCKEEW